MVDPKDCSELLSFLEVDSQDATDLDHPKGSISELGIHHGSLSEITTVKIHSSYEGAAIVDFIISMYFRTIRTTATRIYELVEMNESKFDLTKL